MSQSNESIRPADIHGAPFTLTRSWLRAEPITTTEAKVMRTRIGTLNFTVIEGKKPYTLQLATITVEETKGGWVVTETWKPAAGVSFQ